jgi:hypothetical protein
MGFPLESLEWRTLSFVADQVFGKAERLGPEALSDIERAFWTVMIADGHIVGGTIYRLFHLFPELLETLVQSYRTVGACKKAEAVEKMLSFLPAPSFSEEERLAQVMRIQEEDKLRDDQIQDLHSCYYNSPDEIDVVLYETVQRHRAEFLPDE